MAVGIGSSVHGEFASTDASALTEPNSRFALYGAGGTTALTLDTNDEVIITDYTIVVGASAITVTLYDGANNAAGAGEVIGYGDFAANGGISVNLLSGHVCQKGTWPKVITSGAGALKCTLHGEIRRKGA